MTLQINGIPATPQQIVNIKTDLGLGQVDNTRDADKPVSGPQADAIADIVEDASTAVTAATAATSAASTAQAAATAATSTVSAHTANTSNPHGTTKAQVGLGAVDNTADLDKPISAAQQGGLDQKLSKSGGTMVGPLILAGDATNALSPATLQQVQNLATGLKPKGNTRLITVAALPACTYNNGTAGVGATLTGNSNGALSIDATAVATFDGVVVSQQVAKLQNGRYVVTQPGDASHPFILTRAVDMDTSSECPGAYVVIQGGATKAGSTWYTSVANTSTFTIGTDDLDWVLNSATPSSTDSVSEGSTNLYFTQARVRGAPLTGLNTGAANSAIVATDDTLGAFGKIRARLEATVSGLATEITNRTNADTALNDSITLALSQAVLNLQNQVNALAQKPITLDSIGGALDPTKVGPVTIGGNSFTNLQLAINALAAGTGGNQSPSAPVVLTAPYATFPGSATVTISQATPGVVTQNAHGNANGTYLVLRTTGTLPAPLVPGKLYFRVNVTTNTYQLALTAGGAAIATTSAGTGVHTAYGQADVADVGLYYWGTYVATGTQPTSRNLAIYLSGPSGASELWQTITAVTDGYTLPAIPASTPSGVRVASVQFNEIPVWGGTSSPNPSALYAVPSPGAPTSDVAPSITPTSATELDTLQLNLGAWKINNVSVANSALNFAARWIFTWTLTTSLTGATSATLNTPWLFSAGTFNVTFSTGVVKAVTFPASGGTAVSWSGAVTATAAIEVQVSTSTTTLPLNINNPGHTAKGYVIATDPTTGLSSAEVPTSNTVAVTSSTSGGTTVDAGKQWLTSIPATGTKSLADAAAFFAAHPPPVRAAQDEQAWYAEARAMSGGTVLTGTPTVAQIQAAYTGGATKVGIPAGNYSGMNAMLIMPDNTTLYVVGGGLAMFDCTNAPDHGIRMGANCKLVGVSINAAPGSAIWFYDNKHGQRLYKVGTYNCGRAGWPAFAANGTFDVIGISVESLYCSGGGEGDGLKCGPFGGGNWKLLDFHADKNDDDGIDCWGNSQPNFYYWGNCNENGKNTGIYAKNFASPPDGDGNGVKIGSSPNNVPSTVPSYARHVSAFRNGRVSAGSSGGCGISANNSAAGVHHVLSACPVGDNQNGDYWFSDTPDPLRYTIES